MKKSQLALPRKSFWTIFWIAHSVLFVASIGLAMHLYPKAFPIVDLKITMDRTAALKQAQDLATQMHWGPKNFKQAASFGLNDQGGQTQNFIELSAGGSRAFSEVIQKHLFEPYTWTVRHFAEGDAHETYFAFTPEGKIYDFHSKVPPTDPGAALGVDDALNRAELLAKKQWNILLEPFQLIEKSKLVQPSGRVDHSFTYERKIEKIGEGRYRLKLGLTGNELTEVSHYLKIPESFGLSYRSMRSYNELTKSISVLLMTLLYFVGGCGFGLFYLARKKWVIWKTPLFFAAFVASLVALEQLNQFPLMWMGYDTAISSGSFILSGLLQVLLVFVGEFLLLSISFIAAESLSRKAFPNHVQFWKIWTTQSASSTQILGQTLGGYLSVGPFFAFSVLIYMTGSRYFNWWTPSDILYQPNGLATFFPWLTAVANSFHAGFWEECFFRAIPIAGAALLGDRFGGRRYWIGFAFVIQAFIFASGHADYPAQPYYARVVELILPSFFFGALYVFFGLLPGIVLHYTFDVISFAIPVFSASTPRIWIDQTLIILITAVPLGMVFRSRLKQGHWTRMQAEFFNRAWTPAKLRTEAKSAQHKDQLGALTPRVFVGVMVCSLAVVFIYVTCISLKNETIPLETSQKQAILLAKKALEERGISLAYAGPNSWEILTGIAEEIGTEEEYVWKVEGPQTFNYLTGKYLLPPAWMIRFIKFEGSLEERAEEYQVFIYGKNQLYGVRHRIPEINPGAILVQDEASQLARSSAQSLMLEFYPTIIPSGSWAKEESSTPIKLPARQDWNFSFSDPRIHFKAEQTQGAQARVNVKIAGNLVVSTRPSIYVPDEWKRQERNRQTPLSTLATVCGVILSLLLLVSAFIAVVSWTRKNFRLRAFMMSSLFLSILLVITFLNDIPSRLSGFSTDQPKISQLFTLFAFGFLKIAFISLGTGLGIGYLHDRKKKSLHLKSPHYALAGWAAGVMGVATLSLITNSFPAELPTWGHTAALNSYWPFLTSLHGVEKFISISLFLFIIHLGYVWILNRESVQKSMKHPALGFSFLFMVGLCVQGVNADTFTLWGYLGGCSGILLWVVFRYVIRNHLSLIPCLASGIFTLIQYKQVALQAYPGVTLHGTISIGCVLVIAYFWHIQLDRRTNE